MHDTAQNFIVRRKSERFFSNSCRFNAKLAPGG
jgi:hypothetical protein